MTYLTTFFLILIYIIGAVLAYGRAYAAFQNITFAIMNATISWFGLFIGTISFIIIRDRFYLQFRRPIYNHLYDKNGKIIARDFQEYLDEQLKDPEFRREYKRCLKEDLEFADRHTE